MHKPHPAFLAPENLEVKIWRYIDFEKLESLLDTSSIWFARADRFSDLFEGSYPGANVLARKTAPLGLLEDDLPIFGKMVGEMSKHSREWPRFVAVNCWHINEVESVAMWSLYLRNSEGIALQSTYNRLAESLSVSDQDVFIGQVRYIDYDTEGIEGWNILSPFVHKRKSYEHERELRAVILKYPGMGEKGLDFSTDVIGNGILVPVDVGVLVENIYVAPDAPCHFANRVKSVLDKFGWDLNVTQSRLNAEPQY